MVTKGEDTKLFVKFPFELQDGDIIILTRDRCFVQSSEERVVISTPLSAIALLYPKFSGGHND